MKHILVVDDSTTLARALAACLTAYAVTVSYGSREALDRATALPECDLLVTDYLMPDMDGAELALRVRKVHPTVKVLLVSGVEDELDLAIDPSDARLMKPVAPAELRAAVADLIGPP